MADYCFPDDQLWERADEVIEKIASNSPYSIRYMKQVLRETDGQNLLAGLDQETRVDGILGPDFETRIRVLTEKK